MGSVLDTGQVDLEIEKNVFPVPADNIRLAFKPFGKSRLSQDFANPKRYLFIAGSYSNYRAKQVL